jgi:predicted O-methyltransferase YrrM
MNKSILSWGKFVGGTILSVNLTDIATLFLSRYRFLQSISHTQKAFQKAANMGLPEASAYTILSRQENKEPLAIRMFGDTGLPHATLVPMIEFLKLSGAKRVLEIGTQFGKTTWHLAGNLPEDGHVWTVDLAPASETEKSGRETQPGEEVGAFFQGTPEKEKITQVLKNSLELGPDDFPTLFDYVFVDANHAYDFARADTITALRLLDGEGFIVWHDYYTLDPRIGVRRFLHELQAAGFEFYHLAGSTCAAARVSSEMRDKLLAFLKA